MRLYSENDFLKLVGILETYLTDSILGKKVEVVINGNKKVGIVRKVELERGEYICLLLTFGKKTERIPLLNETKAHLNKELFVIETKNHSTVIEIL